MSASAPLAFFLVEEISFIIALATSSPAFDQASTTLLYFSPWVIRPSLYCCSKSFASVRVWSTIFHFDAGLEGVVEAERHDAVAEDHRLLLAAVPVDLVDHAGDLALGHQLVDDVERDLRALR